MPQTTSKQADKRQYYLGFLVAFAGLYTLYFAQSLIIPLVFSGFIALLLSPLVNKLKRWHVPRPVSAILLLAMLVMPFSFLAAELVEPAQKWAKLLPKVSAQVSEQIAELSKEFDAQEQQAKAEVAAEKEEDTGFNFFGWFSDDDEPEPVVRDTESQVTEQIKRSGIEVILGVLTNAPVVLAQWLASLILILFLLIYGPRIFTVVVSEFPMVKDQDKVKKMVDEIQTMLSKYIITISVINAGLGLATAISFQLMGIEDALLWGVLVGLLNFVPYVGSLISLVMLSLAGAVQFGFVWVALTPAAIYLVINILESQVVTPTVLGKKMQVNPLIIILWLFVCGWLWGMLGALLAVPLLVCVKLILGYLGIWPHWLKLIEA